MENGLFGIMSKKPAFQATQPWITFTFYHGIHENQHEILPTILGRIFFWFTFFQTSPLQNEHGFKHFT